MTYLNWLFLISFAVLALYCLGDGIRQLWRWWNPKPHVGFQVHVISMTGRHFKSVWLSQDGTFRILEAIENGTFK
jgi:hypothetical protein